MTYRLLLLLIIIVLLLPLLHLCLFFFEVVIVPPPTNMNMNVCEYVNVEAMDEWCCGIGYTQTRTRRRW